MKKIVMKMDVLVCLFISAVMLGIGSLFAWDENPVMGFDKLTADALIVLACFGIIFLLRIQKTAGLKGGDFWKGMKLGIPFIIIGIASALISNAGADFSRMQFVSVGNALLFTINMLFVGLNEEIWMRALILNIFLEKYSYSKKGVWRSLILSALLFGAIHIPNAFFMDPVTVAVQVVNAASAGILFGAIFIKCKNIWAGVIVHALVDWLSLFVANCFTSANSILSISMTIPQAIIIIALGSLPPLVIAWLYLRNYSEK